MYMENPLSESKKNEILGLVCRQTKYTREEASKQLEATDYNHMQVLRTYLGIPKETVEKPLSLNQIMFKEYRNFLDKEARAYILRVEQEQTKSD